MPERTERDWPKPIDAIREPLQLLGRAQFLATHPGVFLVELETVVRPRATRHSEVAFSTVIMKPGTPSQPITPPRVLRVHALEKRPGANAFANMITIGRAANNDIVIDREEVSKFHASFVMKSDGSVTILDASSNGTWLDGQRLERTSIDLASGSVIDLAGTVRLVLVSAEQLLKFLEAEPALAKAL